MYGQYRVPPASEMVNFGVGQPAPSLLPLSRVRDAAAAKFAEDDPLFLQYGVIPGYAAFRASLAAFLARGYGGPPVDPELLFVTNGVSGGLGLLCSLLAARGDVVVVEEPSYFLALSIFRDFGLRIVSVPLDENGMDVDALEALLVGGLRPTLAYTIPAFHNPTGYSMSAARKAQLVGLAARYGFTVLADEVYQLLGFEGVAPPPPVLCSYDTAGCVVSMGSFAKILAPGMRLGWLQVSPAGRPLLARLAGCGQLDSSGGVNPVMSGIVHQFIERGHGDAHLAAVRSELTARAAVLGRALREALAPLGATFIQPSGGYFIWIRLPRGVPGLTGTVLRDHCIAHHAVRFHPGVMFGGGLEGHIRLSFSYYSADDLATGARRLGEGLAALVASLTAAAAAPAAPLQLPAPAPAPRAAAPVPAVAVHGATGRLGSLIVGCTSNSLPGLPPSPVTYAGSVARNGVVPVGATVVVDVSTPAGTGALLAALAARPRPALPLVVGVTGDDLPWAALRAYAADAPVVVCANFSLGVPLVLGMLAAALGGGAGGDGGGCGAGTPPAPPLLPPGWSAEVTEVHHTAKRDAPSGTALRLVAALEAAGVAGGAGGAGAPVPVHSLRLGDTVGVHTVWLAGPGERVEITHTATRREVFALGALRLAAWAAGQPPGLYVR